ncbi:MAG: hypothetical protein EAX96_09720 [Candidatus Lokiarchaeota archaeon]|nr:hypothetical protein [Candidatus Lokiarchaeota archaeon]
MFFKLKNLLNKLAFYTKFERMDMIEFYKTEIQKNLMPIRSFERDFNEIWTNWAKKNSKSEVAKFFKEKGDKLLIRWLTEVFPFNNRKLDVKFFEGGTTVDIILKITYAFSNEELFFVEKIISENKIDLSPQIALVRSFAELILIFPIIWNEIIGYEFTIMPENEKEELKKDGLNLLMEFSSRPYY